MPTKQRKNNWINYNKKDLEYHTYQWDNTKESTKHFEVFVKDKIRCSKNIIDLGAGAGSATAYLAERYRNVNFTAADYVNDYLQIGMKMARKKKINNLNFLEIDWYNLNVRKKYDGVISLQTLSWLPEPYEPLKNIFRIINPNWIALTSLFYEGEITANIEIVEHVRNKKSFYNVYSLSEIERFILNYGYIINKFEKFEISIDIDEPIEKNAMSTFTKRIMDQEGIFNERLQISGPILMPWYMVIIERKEKLII